MVFCFDIDGTISARQEVFREIMRSLRNSGHTVYALTGTVIGFNQTGEEYRIDQLRSHGLEKGVDYDDVVVCVGTSPEVVGEMKGEFCRDKEVALLVEDTDIYIASVNKHTKNKTLCLRMAS